MAAVEGSNPFGHLVKNLRIGDEDCKYFDLKALNDPRYDKLPYSIRVLLEAAVRCCDNFQVKEKDVMNILDWEKQQWNETEVAFKPARVILQDFTGVPAVVDFAAMRDAVKRLGGDPQKINPLCPADLVIDHSVQVDYSRSNLNNAPNPGGGRFATPTRNLPLQAMCNDCVKSGGKCRMAATLQQHQSTLPLRSANPKLRSPALEGTLSPPSWRQHPDRLVSRISLSENADSSQDSLRMAGNKTPAVVCPFHQQWLSRGDALQKNQDLEFERNKERFLFLKWGSKAFRNMMIVPPGSGICHQVNLEYLARVVFKQDGFLFPDSLVGADSHTTMINGLGIVGWGVGGIEAEAVMLGQAISMVLPKVVGYRLHGELNPLATSTDVVLTVTKHLRQVGVVNKFVEFFGPGVAQLSIADRATISNMCPEYGATIGFFPVDSKSLDYLIQSGRDQNLVEYVESYLKAVNMFRDLNNPSQDITYSEVVELDLSQVVPSLSGPKRPQDKVPVTDMKSDFLQCLQNKVGFKGFNIPPEQAPVTIPFVFEGKEYTLKHGSVVIAAITSCTNTSNPSVMLGAGLLAKKAVEKGLSVGAFVKTSLSPGSGVVTHYLKESGVTPFLQQLGFDVVGYGCMTCIGNSGPLPDVVINAIEKGDLVAVSVLSGNRNFEGRVHPHTRANYLTSPLLVVAYALAGRVDIDFEVTPIGQGNDGQDVFLRDIWPSRNEIQEVEKQYVIPALFKNVYSQILEGDQSWSALEAPESILYPWDNTSTYIKNPPFFESMTKDLPSRGNIQDARVLVHLGDFVTTDHISPAGSIARNSAAARYLGSKGLTPREFNSFGSRRGNDAVMARGTFANIRLLNRFIGKAGPKTLHIPSGDEADVFDAAERYGAEGTTLIILAGKDYGCGSSRDWAAKGPMLLGVKAVIAESYERIHRSNLVGMGIIPLEYMPGQNADSLGLSGKETYSIHIPQTLTPKMTTTVKLDNGKSFDVVIRFDTEVELTYFENGGILQYMIRKMLQ